ncbi:MAG TPA: tyrosine-type recombinase/integrase [Vicinamibacterales bacterium]|nr:tyrosine-type recombinase/integrase [Vicinamibacterales bacterium]
MSRRGRRVRLGRGIYRDRSGLAAVVSVGGRQVEKRFPPDTPLSALRAWQQQVRYRLTGRLGPTVRGTLEEDAARYLAQKRYLASYLEVRSEVRAWLRLYGARPRARLTAEHVRAAIAEWSRLRCQRRGCGLLQPAGASVRACPACGGPVKPAVAPKTINNRIQRLRNLYHTLDGPDLPTPCDGVRLLPVHKTPPVRISREVVNAVVAQLEAFERQGRLRDARTRARFMVEVSTGRRPSEIARARPEDVDLLRRVWIVRDGKGGFSPGLYLTDDMLVAWQLFFAAAAWGPYDTGSRARVLRAAGWPAHVRPYHARHSFGLELSELGVDLADVAAALGHRRLDTTRRHYVPVLGSRIQRALELLEGRFGWAAPRPREAPAGKPS